MRREPTSLRHLILIVAALPLAAHAQPARASDTSAPGAMAASAAGAAPSKAAEAPYRLLTLDDLARERSLSDLRVAPDGRHAVMQISFVDTERDKYSSDLWLLDLEDGTRRRLTVHPGTESHPRFSPDGTRLAFLAERDGRARVYALSFAGGEPMPLIEFDEEIEEYEWFPDGERIAFIAKQPIAKKAAGPSGEDKDESKKVRIFTRTKFKADGEGYLDGRYTHLWSVDLATGRIRKLTEGDFDHGSPAISPDGRLIAFVSNRTADPDTNLDSDIFAVPSRGGEIVRVSGAPGTAFNPRWSPDGKRLAFLEQSLPDTYGANRYLWVASAPRGGTVLPAFGEPRNLTEWLDRSVGAGSYRTEAEFYPIWSPDSRRLYVAIEDRARLHGYAIDPVNGERTLLIGGDRLVEFLTPSPDGRRLFFSLHDGTNPGDVYISTTKGTKIDRLTRLNADWLDQVRLSPAEGFTFKSFDGWQIEGWVVKPPDFDAGRKYPAVLTIHGGPSWYYTGAYEFFHQLLAARGYVVIYTNPRGSTTYGETFMKSVRGRFGLEDFKDMMAGLDTVVALGWVDEENLFITGYSYGGMMTNWAITQTDRFRAAASGASDADYSATVGPDDVYVDWISEFGGAPWEVPDAYRLVSPIFYITNAKTPTLFLHGMEDDRDPVSESERMYLALRLLKVETKLALFPGESHGLDEFASSEREYKRLVIEWFDQHRLW
jgi:acylaminoacyl-peptidase